LSGCTVPEGISRQSVEKKAAELEDMTRSRIVSVVDDPYVGVSSVAIPAADSDVFSRIITIHRTDTIEALCAIAAKLTGLIVSVEASSGSETASTPSNAALDAQLQAAMRNGGSSSSAPAPSLPSSSHRKKIRVDYEGPVKGLLDLLSSHSGLGWEYSIDSGVVFASTMVKTFTVWAVPGEVKFDNKISNEANQSSSNPSTANGTVNSQETQRNTSQTHISQFNINVWKEVEDNVKAQLSPTGKVSISQASSTVTVRDSFTVIRNVGKYIDDLNKRLARQIALSIKVYSVEISDTFDAGLNLSMLFDDGHTILNAAAMPLKALDLGGEMSATIVDGKLKSSSSMLKALRSLGHATQVTSGGGVVMSNQSVPIQAIRREAYLAATSTSTTEYGQTAALTPGEITTGFAMTVVPHILEGRRVILYYSIDLSSVEDIVSFQTGGSTVQLPKVASRAFSQRMNLKMGQTIVLAGFEQIVDSRDDAGGLFGYGKSREFRKSLMIITIETELGDV
jgi:type IVB pilus formation R64 PilN family outer membrane protein